MDLVRREAASSLSVLSRSHPVQSSPAKSSPIQSTYFSLYLLHPSSPNHPLTFASPPPPPVNKIKRGNYKNKSKKLINRTRKTAVISPSKGKDTNLVQSNPIQTPSHHPTHPSVQCKTKRENAALWRSAHPSLPVRSCVLRCAALCCAAAAAWCRENARIKTTVTKKRTNS